ncbi:MFS transporter [Janibacter corallicola]|uniref:MFS transporter n=1 Tax=Janibacter corallicola TaxID=415212 RepID=UPI00082CECD3|nr:MFS transporter [Janibacter corallicola]
MSSQDVPGTNPRFGVWLTFLAVALISVNLRPGATSIGPLLEEVGQTLGMGSAAAGALTSLPGLTFAVAGAGAVALARRVGLSRGIMFGLVAMVLTLLIRVTTDSAAIFLLLSTLGLAGMGLGNVLVPAWIKRHSNGRREVQLMTIYSMGLTVGGAVAPLIATPVAHSLPGGWRPALGLWGVVAFVALLPWLVVAARDRVHRRTDTETPSLRLGRSPTAIALTALFGIQSANAYIQFGWLPQIYRDAGISQATSGVYMSIVTGMGIIGGLIMPTIIDRSPDISRWMIAFGGFASLGYLGLLLAPASAPWLWAILLGISGFAFPAAIALITARSRHSHVTAQLSGFVQPVGYLLAGVFPFIIGLLHDSTGGWAVPLVVLILLGPGITISGLRVSRPVFVDDEVG